MEERDYRERLARDIAGWQRSEIISEAQGRAILARYGAGEAHVAHALRLGWLVTAVSIIGALVLAGGVVLLFAANWEQMPDLLRTAMVVGGVLASYAIAYVLIERYDMQRIGSAFLLLGALIFQAGLFLLAQIYNMPVESPVLFLLGMLGGLPLAYLFGSRIILLLSLSAGVAWQAMRVSERHEGTTGEEWITALLIGALAIALYAFGRLHEVRTSLAKLGEVYVLIGGVIAIAIVYSLTFDEPWEEIISQDVQAFALTRDIYGMMLLAWVLVAAQLVVRTREVETYIDIVAQAALLSLALVAGSMPNWDGWAIVFNAAFFGIAAALVAKGYAASDERYINAGLGAVAIGLITRYCDTFWSLLAGSVFFLVGGVLLLALAFGLERVRRGLLDSIDDDPPDATPLEVTA